MVNSFSLLILASAVLTVVFRVFAEPLLLTFGASEDSIGYALDYMKIYSLGTLFVQVTLGMNAYITAQGFTTVSMKTVLIGAGLNTLLDPIFIFGLGMGVRGAALATILSQAVSAAWVLRFLTSPQTKWRLRRETLRLQPKVFLPSLALGLSPFIMQSTESLIAVCEPTDTKDMFFYFYSDADGNMQAVFSQTYEQHQQAIADNSGTSAGDGDAEAA